MAKKEKLKKPPVGLAIKRRPLPKVNKYKEDIKEGLSRLKRGHCLEAPFPDDWDKGIIAWQRYVSTIVYNYKVKQQTESFTVRVLNDNTVGIWFKQ